MLPDIKFQVPCGTHKDIQRRDSMATSVRIERIRSRHSHGDETSVEDRQEVRFEPQEIACEYMHVYQELLPRIDLGDVEQVVNNLQSARCRGATIFVAGNGGSAATAMHLVNDLGKATKLSGRLPMRVMNLSDNTSWVTALANDEGYERVFAGQLENFAQPGDLLIVISASGNSANLVRAVDLAHARGLKTIGLLGFDGGILKEKVDQYIWLPTEKGMYGHVEDCHAMLCHILATCLAQIPATDLQLD